MNIWSLNKISHDSMHNAMRTGRLIPNQWKSILRK